MKLNAVNFLFLGKYDLVFSSFVWVIRGVHRFKEGLKEKYIILCDLMTAADLKLAILTFEMRERERL